ncbi:MAG: Ni/Fe hydrogenase subunit alpha [Nitrospirota bacterium]
MEQTLLSSEGRWRHVKIDVNYIARVEGEASVKFEIRDRKLVNLKLNIWEPPRFFEGFLVGRKFYEAPDIVSRICGICPVSHMTTSICAVENALGVVASPEIKKIRDIMTLSQIAASHVIHLYMLTLPDYYGLAMLSEREKEMNSLLRLKEALNNVTGAIGGRPLHPVAMVVGGFTKALERKELSKLIKGLEGVKKDAVETIKMFSELDYPVLKNDTEYLALSGADGYAINEGIIATSSGVKVEPENYHSFFSEKEVSYSNAKKTVLKGERSVMAGALARLNLKFDRLHPEAKKAAREVGFLASEKNPFSNIVAQAVEIAHCIWTCIDLLDTLTCKDTLLDVRVREGSGTSVTEAPRGLLYHHYELNRLGVIEKADIVTPTAYNFLNIEESLEKLVMQNIDKPPEELSLLCEMLVRAYDPCFSCSVH